jgi:hypothetical protein
MSFTEKAITIVITGNTDPANNQLGSSAPAPARFGPNKLNTLTLAGYRVSVTISIAGPSSGPQANIAIYGMNLSDMNALAALGNLTYAYNNNTVSVIAGDNEVGTSLVFEGNMTDAAMDFNAVPEVCFNITAYTTLGLSMIAVPVSSFGGAAQVSTIMSQFAMAGNYIFENNGVTSVLSNPYFAGTLQQQIQECARAANINWIIDATTSNTALIGANQGTLAIWPKYGIRNKTPITISPTTGMVGYPTFSNYSMNVTMEFNPTILFGAPINVQSSLSAANKTWHVYGIQHSIESQTNNGDWFTTVTCPTTGFFGQPSS